MKRRNQKTEPFVPTHEQLEMAKTMAGFGIPQLEIMRLIIDPFTEKPIGHRLFKRHFGAALHAGMTTANAKVVQSLFVMATGRAAQYDEAGNLLKAELEPKPNAAIWWTKARLGWKGPPTETRVAGPDGGAIQTQEVATVHTYIPGNNRDPAEQRAPRKVSRKSG